MSEELPEDDLPPSKTSIGAKANSGITPERRDSRMAWYRAQLRGWTREQFDTWVLTGDEPDGKDRDTDREIKWPELP